MRTGFWKHEKSMDVFYEIVSVPYKGPDYAKIKYYVWNDNEFGEPFKLLHTSLRARINKEDYPKWKKYNPFKRNWNETK